MTNKQYESSDLFRIAAANYVTLTAHCAKLQEEGYWEQPQKLLQQTIQEVLDLYLQSFLLMYASRTDELSVQQRQYLIRTVPSNPLCISQSSDDIGQSCETAAKFLSSPPILLQLFSLRDREHQSNLTQLFIDTMLNIMIAMSCLNKDKQADVVLYLRAYFTGNSVFLSEKLQFFTQIDEHYIFRKISNSHFETGYDKEKISEPVVRKTHIKTLNQQVVSKKKAAPKKKLEPEEIAKATAQAKLELERTKDAKRAASVEKMMAQLDDMVGLESVKTEMRSLVNLIKVRKMRSNLKLPQMDMTYHMVFTGNAGTGKTTVARLVAEIYKELGVLSKGTFVEVDRAGLVAGYLGQTAMKVKEVVERAKGGVLFIDEAYSLVSRDAGDDYGIEAIDTLVKEMEDNRNDLVVIVAGYRKEMEYFLKSNTGLVSRFNKYIDFPDYTNDQLVEIMIKMAQKAAMTMEEEAIDKVKDYLEGLSALEHRDFGNARGIRNAFEKIVINQANRLVGMDTEPGVEELSKIKAEDVMF